ncbi:MAG: hypothetical protein ACFNS6_03105, partial [Candidatus Saccharimonas sp.]
MPPNNLPPNQAPMPAPMPPAVAGSGQNIAAPGDPAGNPGAPSSTDPKKGKGKEQPKATSTQNSLIFSELRDSMVVMNDGSFRAIVACKSINFDLMSSRERDGVELSYQDFLNALYFPIQIFIRSQRVDIGPYLDKLDALRRDQDNMLLGVLMDDYINFIDVLSQEANIMDKSFFVVIPYFPTGDVTNIVQQSKGIFSILFGSKKENVTKIDTQTYAKAKEEIKNRVDSVIGGLMRVGVDVFKAEVEKRMGIK